ncbi:ribosome maturation factor RimM [Desertimonas flava]|uniref:ribosome maturation factor RimM n=1 Tax=Desertimonas flava TaxID=2064846 RepID=UPI000E3545F6|nr:ribosome maturation factor RimM [Desertimonas flava]
MSAVPDGLLEVGHIRRAHGVRGEMSVELSTERLERVTPGARWFTRGEWMEVTSARPHQDRWLVTLAGVSDRTGAQRLTNAAIYAEPIDDPDELWVHRLIGARVVDTAGRDVGRCTAVVSNPAADLLELDDGRLVPVVFVTSLDASTAGDVVTIDPPEGLLDL